MSNKQSLFLSIFTFLTVLAWIVFDVYHASTISTVTPIQQELIKPLEPRFDTTTILELKGEINP